MAKWVIWSLRALAPSQLPKDKAAPPSARCGRGGSCPAVCEVTQHPWVQQTPRGGCWQSRGRPSLAVRLCNAQGEFTPVMKSGQLSRSLSAGFCFIQPLLVTGQQKVTELQRGTSVPLINGKGEKTNCSSSFTREFPEFLHRLCSSLTALGDVIRRSRKAFPLTSIFVLFWTMRNH